MTEESTPPGEFTTESGPRNSTRVQLIMNNQLVSRLNLFPFTIRIGRAAVPMAGVGDVATPEEFRNRGHSRCVILHAINMMRQGPAALTMLFGIRNFYHKFGFATVGPEHGMLMKIEKIPPEIPPGFTVRGFQTSDFPAVRKIYDSQTRLQTGAAIRPEADDIWQVLLKFGPDPASTHHCRVILDAQQQIVAYVWWAREFWCVRDHDTETGAFAIGEIMATNPASANAVLNAVLRWGTESPAGTAREWINLNLPPGGHVYNAATYRHCRVQNSHLESGGSMAQVLNTARLLCALLPELQFQLQKAQGHFTGIYRVETEVGAAYLQIEDSRLQVLDSLSPAVNPNRCAKLPQSTLARLALGAFPVDDLLARTAPNLNAEIVALLKALFPQRAAHMYWPGPNVKNRSVPACPQLNPQSAA